MSRPEAPVELVWVAKRAEIPPGGGRTVDVRGTPVAVFDAGGTLHALHAVCPHAQGPLGEGPVEDDAVVCPLHGWRFELATGRCRTVPRARVARYEVRVDGDDVWVGATPVEG